MEGRDTITFKGRREGGKIGLAVNKKEEKGGIEGEGYRRNRRLWIQQEEGKKIGKRENIEREGKREAPSQTKRKERRNENK